MKAPIVSLQLEGWKYSSFKLSFWYQTGLKTSLSLRNIRLKELTNSWAFMKKSTRSRFKSTVWPKRLPSNSSNLNKREFWRVISSCSEGMWSQMLILKKFFQITLSEKVTKNSLKSWPNFTSDQNLKPLKMKKNTFWFLTKRLKRFTDLKIWENLKISKSKLLTFSSSSETQLKFK